MATLKKLSLTGNEIGKVNVEESLLNAEANGQMIKDYIVALRANARQWSANTKGRSEVNHSTKKPHPQKGGGRSRQGRLSSPQYKGGGRVHAPKPKFDQHVRINRKERLAAIRFLISEKIKENRFYILENTKVEEPKTKVVSNFLDKAGFKGRVLFLGEGEYIEVKTDDTVKLVSVQSDKHHNFIKSLRNIPKIEFSLAKNVSGYDLLIAHDIVITEAAFKELNEWLS